MTQDDIRTHLQRHAAVLIQIADAEDGSPRIAWGDTFFYVRDADGHPRKMPFATIVIKDYPGFDSYSDLDRGGLYRLNIEVGKEKFEELFRFKTSEFEAHRDRFDFAAIDELFPHPVYGSAGWVSIVNPGAGSAVSVESLLDFSLQRALRRATA